MAENEIKNINQLKKKLGVVDIANITNEQVKSFIEILPDVDKDVAIEFIKQLPSSIQATSQMTEQLRLLVSDGFSSSNNSSDACMKGYQSVIDSMAEAVKDGDYSFEENKILWDKMESLAMKMDEKDTENKKFIRETLHDVGMTLLKGALIVGVIVFGVNKYREKGDE